MDNLPYIPDGVTVVVTTWEGQRLVGDVVSSHYNDSGEEQWIAHEVAIAGKSTWFDFDDLEVIGFTGEVVNG